VNEFMFLSVCAGDLVKNPFWQRRPKTSAKCLTDSAYT